MKKANIYLAEGFEELEAVAIIDILRRGGVKVNLVSIDGKETVKGAHNISFVTDFGLDNMERDIDANILPGGMPGSDNLFMSNRLKSYFSEFIKEGSIIAAICAAPGVLGRWGMLNGKFATSYPGVEKLLSGAKLKDENVVVDGNFVTSKGPGTAIIFALEILSMLEGKNISDKVKKEMLVS